MFETMAEQLKEYPSGEGLQCSLRKLSEMLQLEKRGGALFHRTMRAAEQKGSSLAPESTSQGLSTSHCYWVSV